MKTTIRLSVIRFKDGQPVFRPVADEMILPIDGLRLHDCFTVDIDTNKLKKQPYWDEERGKK